MCPLVRTRQSGSHRRLEKGHLHTAPCDQEPHGDTQSQHDGESGADRPCHREQEGPAENGRRRRAADRVTVALEEEAGPPQHLTGRLRSQPRRKEREECTEKMKPIH